MQPRTLQCGHVLSAVEMWVYADPGWAGDGGLQCGHVLSAVEIYRLKRDTPSLTILQCGHVLSAVPWNMPLMPLLARRIPSFNAATSFRPWKFVPA